MLNIVNNVEEFPYICAEPHLFCLLPQDINSSAQTEFFLVFFELRFSPFNKVAHTLPCDALVFGNFRKGEVFVLVSVQNAELLFGKNGAV